MQKLVLTKALGDSLTAPVNGVELKAGDSIIASGLAGAEEVALYVLVGTTFIPAKDTTGGALKLTATHTGMAIHGAGTYQIQVGATTAAITISFNTPVGVS